MRWLVAALALALSVGACSGVEEPTGTTESVSSGTSTTAGEASASTPAIPPDTSPPSSGALEGWTGKEVELRRPPGSESVPGPFDSVLQSVVWIDGRESGLWTWDTPGHGIYLVGEGANPHRVQWEPEATPDAPPPEPAPIEPGTINDLMVWALTTLEEYPDGAGGRYRIVDWQPIRLVESDVGFALTTSDCFYNDDRDAVLFGWVSAEDVPSVPESGDPPPIEPWLAFELAATSEGRMIAAVDPKSVLCAP